MLIVADARRLPLRDSCVSAVVTSPPYWGLRDYGSADQIGLERTPDAYVASLVAVFAEVRRVLRADGTVWLNLGDSYSGGNTGSQTNTGQTYGRDGEGHVFRKDQLDCVKPKNLIGIPWRVALALQADGWYLRSDIIWAKPNPLPESVTDRPTKSHEHLFLLAKSEHYHYDAEAIKEPITADSADRYDYPLGGAKNEHLLAEEATTASCRTRMNGRRTLRKSEAEGTNGRKRPDDNSEAERRDQIGSFNNNPRLRPDVGRNKRDVWTVPVMPYSGAHFATFPEKLIEPCILAGCPLGGLVFDPFVGSGTVGAVAERLGRRWVGTDLSYQPLAQARTAQRGIRWETEEPESEPARFTPGDKGTPIGSAEKVQTSAQES